MAHCYPPWSHHPQRTEKWNNWTAIWGAAILGEPRKVQISWLEKEENKRRHCLTPADKKKCIDVNSDHVWIYDVTDIKHFSLCVFYKTVKGQRSVATLALRGIGTFQQCYCQR